MTSNSSASPERHSERELRLIALSNELAEAAVASDPDRGGRALTAMVQEFGPEIFTVLADGLVDVVLTKLREHLAAGDPAAYATIARLHAQQ